MLSRTCGAHSLEVINGGPMSDRAAEETLHQAPGRIPSNKLDPKLAISACQKALCALCIQKAPGTRQHAGRPFFSFGVAFVPRVRPWLCRVAEPCDIEQHAPRTLSPARRISCASLARYRNGSRGRDWAVLAVVSDFLSTSRSRCIYSWGCPGPFWLLLFKRIGPRGG